MLKEIAQPMRAHPPRAGATGAAALQESEDKEPSLPANPGCRRLGPRGCCRPRRPWAMERADRRLLRLLALELTIAALIAAAAATECRLVLPNPLRGDNSATWFRAALIRP